MRFTTKQTAVALITQLIICIGQSGCVDESTSAQNASVLKQHSDMPATQTPASPPLANLSRDDLLDLAFQISTSIPIEPFASDRARMQALVAQACIKNGSLIQAIQYASKIEGWRQGELFALIGQQYASANETQLARDFAARAMEVAANEIDWRREQIVIETAKLYLQLGDSTKASALVEGATQAELGKIEAARTAIVLQSQLDNQADMFDKALATKNFDLARGAIEGYLVWLDRVSEDEIRTTRALKAIDDALPGLPFDLQVKYAIDLADHLHKNLKRDLAILKLDKATEIFSATTFLPEDVAPLGAMIARARIRMGDPQSARVLLQRFYSEHSTRREGIVNLRRATSLRALAEGFCELGDRDDAIACYTWALEEGTINPNARPRAEDLGATCISMAEYGIVLTPELKNRIDTIRNSLTDPW
ncbi:hypothetical protein LBMAG51_04400 [Phycisphaerae bacterium]|nr:hypothetical protein LBMAG51_04400 [Phycisphaerae bacterium]